MKSVETEVCRSRYIVWTLTVQPFCRGGLVDVPFVCCRYTVTCIVGLGWRCGELPLSYLFQGSTLTVKESSKHQYHPGMSMVILVDMERLHIHPLCS